MWGEGEKNKPHPEGGKQTSKVSDWASLVCTGNNHSKTSSRGLTQTFVYEDGHHNTIIVKKSDISSMSSNRKLVQSWWNT